MVSVLQAAAHDKVSGACKMTERIFHKDGLDVTAFYGGMSRGKMLHIVGDAQLSKEDVMALVETLHQWLEGRGPDTPK